jgi:hypothetical protein
MSEPLRTQPTPGRDEASPVDPAAQIERLLLSGLDLYFAGQFQDAINIWTRVVFLERGHGRARAYIERARTAIAEQQRESDELFHRGRLAYDSGRLDDARQLLTRAVEKGGSTDDALLLLQQLNRFAGSGSPAPTASGAGVTTPAAVHRGHVERGWAWGLGAVALVSTIALLSAPLVSWFGAAPVVTSGPVAGPVEPLPIVRTGDMAFENARRLYTGGHLADALRALEGIDIGDPVRPQAERLKGEIQRDLLATVRQSRAAAVAGAR